MSPVALIPYGTQVLSAIPHQCASGASIVEGTRSSGYRASHCSQTKAGPVIPVCPKSGPQEREGGSAQFHEPASLSAFLRTQHEDDGWMGLERVRDPIEGFRFRSPSPADNTPPDLRAPPGSGV